jgi:hypothetical protein
LGLIILIWPLALVLTFISVMYDCCSGKSVVPKKRVAKGDSAKGDSDNAGDENSKAGDEDIEACNPEANDGRILKGLAKLSEKCSLMPLEY